MRFFAIPSRRVMRSSWVRGVSGCSVLSVCSLLLLPVQAADSSESAEPSAADDNPVQQTFDLFEAIYKRNLRAASVALDHKANVNVTDLDGWTPLSIAAAQEDSYMITLLINRGAEINAQAKNGQTALMVAAAVNSSVIVRQLVQNGAMLDTRDQAGWTPLMKAIDRGATSSSRALIDLGANINVQDHRGQTPLTLALRHAQTGFPEVLVEKGADLKKKDASGKNALLVVLHNNASERADIELTRLIQVLITRGADPNAQDDRGWTPLMYAAEWRNSDVVLLLLRRGARTDMVNKDGKTALDIMLAHTGNASLVDLLRTWPSGK